MRLGEVVGHHDAGGDRRGRTRRDDGRPLGQPDRGEGACGTRRRHPRDVGTLRRGRPRADCGEGRLVLDSAAGEILAVAGVQGNGQTELAEALTGLRAATDGTITIGGHDVTGRSVRDFFEAGVGHIPEDRQRHGLVLSMSIDDNLVLNLQRDRRVLTVGNEEHEGDPGQRGPAARGVRHPGRERPSPREHALGGQPAEGRRRARAVPAAQARWCAPSPRGGSTSARSSTCTARSSRSATPVSRSSSISSELDEIIALGDRIAVMYEGQIVGIVPPTTSREQLGLMMAGAAARGDRRGRSDAVTTARDRARTGAVKSRVLRAAHRLREASTFKVTLLALAVGLFFGALLIMVDDARAVPLVGWALQPPRRDDRPQRKDRVGSLRAALHGQHLRPTSGLGRARAPEPRELDDRARRRSRPRSPTRRR